jgi:hypothetical protein
MSGQRDWPRYAANAGAVAVLVVLSGYLVSSAFFAGLPARVLLSQENACVIRADVCQIVAALRRAGAPRFEIGSGLTPEVLQRLGEFAYPLRVGKGQPIRVALCAQAKPEERVVFRVRDAKRRGDDGAELCILDRR